MSRLPASLLVVLLVTPAIAGEYTAQVDKWPKLPARAGLLVQPLVGSEQASLSLLAVAPNSAVTHDRATGGQFFLYVVEGALFVRGQEKPLGPGDGALLAADVANTLRNDRAKTAQVLVLEVPGEVRLDFERAEAASAGEAGSTAPVVRRASAAPKHVIGGGKGSVRMLFEGDPSYPAYVGVLRAEPGMVVPPHHHATEAELLFILSGTGEMTLGNDTFPVRAGMAVMIPPATSHSLSGVRGKGLEAVQVYAPPGPEQRFKPQKNEATP